MPTNIDVDRGVLIRIHPKSGMNVYMYVDTPGVYLNNFGNEVGEKIANEAGYDIVKFGKERVKRERMQFAMNAIEQELSLVDDEATKTVVTKEGYRIDHIGLGRHMLYDPDGNQLTMVGMPLTQAKVLMEEMIKAEKKPIESKTAQTTLPKGVSALSKE